MELHLHCIYKTTVTPKHKIKCKFRSHPKPVVSPYRCDYLWHSCGWTHHIMVLWTTLQSCRFQLRQNESNQANLSKLTSTVFQRAMLQLIIKQYFPVKALLEAAQLAVKALISLPLGFGTVKSSFLMNQETRPCLCSIPAGGTRTHRGDKINQLPIFPLSHIFLSDTTMPPTILELNLPNKCFVT